MANKLTALQYFTRVHHRVVQYTDKRVLLIHFYTSSAIDNDRGVADGLEK